MIPNLVPIETYFVDETGYWARMPFIIGLLMMVMGTAIVWSTIGDSLRPVEILERGIGGGAGFVSGAARRLVCSRLTLRSGVPGALFFETGRITFLPQLARQSHLSVEFPSASVAVSMERRPRNVMQRALLSADPVLMRLDSPSESALFMVPAPSQTISLVRTVVDNLRRQGAR